MSKLNCWEFMKCGREKNGTMVNTLGECPVAAESSAHSLNGGVNGGRICWVVSDICRDNEFRCSHGSLKDSCFSCEFRYKVMMDEGLLNVCRATGLLLQLHDKKNIEKINNSLANHNFKF